MHHIDSIQSWYITRQIIASRVQILLAADYVANYGYPLDTACQLALQSYRVDFR